MHAHPQVALVGTIDDRDRDVCEIIAWPDADLAGDHNSSRSTSGRFIEVVGPGTRVALHWASHKQGSTSHSTPEAETVSLSDCLRVDLPFKT